MLRIVENSRVFANCCLWNNIPVEIQGLRIFTPRSFADLVSRLLYNSTHNSYNAGI